MAYQIGQYFKENEIKNQSDGGNRPEEQSPQHLLAHTILGAAVSAATGNDIATGAISGAANEAAAPILSNYLYGTNEPSELNQEQKDTITSIITLGTASIAYGAMGDVSVAVNASEVGKGAVEWNKSKNSLHTSKAINNEKCRNGDAGACEVRTLGDILGEYADKYHDLTIYSVDLGAVSYTVIVNNRNGSVWIGGVPESDNYRAGYGLSLNPKDLMTTIKEDTRTGKTPRVLKSTIGGSVQVGTVVGVTKPEEVDKAIEGRSLGVQGCHFGCLGISKGEGKNGAVIVTTGVGTTQIGVNGSVMRQLTDKEKKTLQDLGVLR
ncbi:VENN motif pre-toxin domain-containing protein [Moraxella nonliquefaciens]|uniref:VENN motif pre-toxin domain-containing protein n=1 Tax=Moraxella nonliquefaciens TaxID=478 RepID=A0A1B8QHC0_MORNO|nr:VENN motif pre-toxin domain-containing protein [Moraxella nonliquefaciens]OBX82782.1 hypothetical protein A7456_06980 [Moraxella nonliquefaciens]QPT44915.1 VENN motif pre-toxin domain-containing protein [Moraxella nonliquefaciens]QQC29946.1 VENN motif pre-toxin domain-containing protein [Moraxella nonliquefaciens]